MTAIPAAAHAQHRLVVVVGERSDPRVTQQNEYLKNETAALRERDVVVQDITPEAARHARPELGVGAQTDFQVLLVGKDGGVKLRRGAPVDVTEIAAFIDTMPMRQSETKR